MFLGNNLLRLVLMRMVCSSDSVDAHVRGYVSACTCDYLIYFGWFSSPAAYADAWDLQFRFSNFISCSSLCLMVKGLW